MRISQKKEQGQFFTENVAYMCQNLIDVFPPNATIIDPFVGNWDLLDYLDKSFTVIGYDKSPHENHIKRTIHQDTLLHPVTIDKESYVFTNPPYLYRKFNPDKTYYDLYGVNDLYKASILSLIKSKIKGGILITPLNFLSGLDHKFRKTFFKHYSILHCNVFHEQVFSDTTITVIAFKFLQKASKKNIKEEIINTILYPANIPCQFTLEEKYGYQIGGEIRYKTKKIDIKVSRLMEGDPIPNSQLFLRAIDSSNKADLISLSLNPERYYGKETDRTFATIVLSCNVSLKNQQRIVDLFNHKFQTLRDRYHGLFLTNFREKDRKRIGLSFAYDLIEHCIAELEITQRQLTSYF